MSEKDPIFERLRNTISQIKGHVHILEQCVSVEAQMRYFKFSELLRKQNKPPRPLTDEQCLELYEMLYEPERTEHEKKYSLLMLATSKNVKAFRLLQEFVENDPDIALREWASLALMDCQISLESELSGEQQIYISTGLGGKDEKLRFSILFLIANKQTVFEDYQKHVIERESADIFEQNNCELETMQIGDRFVLLKLLIPFRSDIPQILGKVIVECNQYGNFLSTTYTVTNVQELTEKDAYEILNQDEDNNGNH